MVARLRQPPRLTRLADGTLPIRNRFRPGVATRSVTALGRADTLRALPRGLKLRIAIVIERFLPHAGGVENVAWQVAHGLVRAGEDVTVITRESTSAPEHTPAPFPRSPSPDPKNASSRPVPALRRIASPTVWQPLRVLVFSHRAGRATRLRADFDVVHGFSRTRYQDLYRAGGGSHADYLDRSHPGTPGSAAATLPPPPGAARDRAPGSSRIRASAFNVPPDSSQKLSPSATASTPTASCSSPNGVDLERYDSEAARQAGRALREREAPGAGPLWLFPASGWPRKGLDTLLEAWPRITRPTTRLWVAGRDAPEPWQRRAARLGLSERVRFPRSRRDLEVLYHAVDGMVLPTRYDAFANVTLEAAAAGLAIVTTRANGAAEWLGDGVVRLEDATDPLALAGALDVLDDPERRAALGAEAAGRAQTLGWSGPRVGAPRGVPADRRRPTGSRRGVTARRIEWHAGDELVRQRVEAWLADPASVPSRELADNPRRAVHRLGDETGQPPPLVVKRHRNPSRHPVREMLKRVVGRSPARREWRALERLHAAGIGVPRPLAWGRLQGGDELVVSVWHDGSDLRAALEGADEPTRATILEMLGEAIARLHAKGARHGDLHQGNLLVENDRITLLDVQRARKQATARQRLEDLARLELSLARVGLSRAERERLRQSLSVPVELDPALRRFLRDHVRGRSRRTLRVGRRWRRVRTARGIGLCEAPIEPQSIEAWIAESESRGDGSCDATAASASSSSRRMAAD